MNKITIKETTTQDLSNLMCLWNNPEVMRFVGYPNGLEITMSKMLEWLPWAISKPERCHYSIYFEERFCGETFYNVDTIYETAALDIKLVPDAQGRGIATQALCFAMREAFLIGNAKRVYVDPYPENQKAWKLYRKLGFIERPRPEYLSEWETYLEISFRDWKKASHES